VFGKKTVKIDKHLWNKIAAYSEAAGYAAPEEFMVHTLEKAMAQMEDADSDEELMNKLRGLGYIS